MLKINLLAIGTAALGFTAAANAQDANTSPTPFSGLYVGASGGYDIQPNDTNARLQFDRNGSRAFADTVTTAAGADAFSPGFCNGRALGPTRDPASGCESDRDRGSFYGRVGYNRQYGHVVLGVMGEFGKTEIKDYTSGFSTTPASYTFERAVNWEGTAQARAGLAFGDAMFYATGGVGYADIRHRFATTNTANAFAGNGNSKKAGYVVGGGVEKFITKRVTLGVEYSYHNYKDGNYNVLVTQGSAPATNPFVLAPYSSTTIRRSDNNFNWSSLRATVGFHF